MEKEYLVLSYTEIYNQTNGGKMFDKDSQVNVTYYDGKKFSSRLTNENELSEYRKTYPDVQIIFEGEVNENLIETKSEDHYTVFYDARYWMQFAEKQYEDIVENE